MPFTEKSTQIKNKQSSIHYQNGTSVRTTNSGAVIHFHSTKSAVSGAMKAI